MWESGANVDDTKYSAFPFLYEKVLRAEEERARARAAARAPMVPRPVHFPEHVQISSHP